MRPSDTILKKRKVVETEFYQEFASLSKILSLGEEHPKLKLEFGVTDILMDWKMCSTLFGKMKIFPHQNYRSVSTR